MRAFIIWNEPDDPSQGLNLEPDHFAGLMHECYQKIKEASGELRVGSGGILWPRGAGGATAQQATDHVVEYLEDVYDYIKTYNGGIPWDFLNVHVHHYGFTNEEMSTLRKSVDAVFTQSGRRPIIVGEWGLHIREGNDAPTGLSQAFTRIRNHFTLMLYFQHPKRDAPLNGNPCDPNSPDFGLITFDQNPAFYKVDRCVLWHQLHAAYSV